jgi:acetolactate synthase I/II/III large subunit
MTDIPMASGPDTAARRMLQLAGELGVRYIFTNLGSDHPAFIEAFAHIDEVGGVMPEVIVCPHEMTALSAAHGYAMITRRPQMVLVHVDVGTQNLGCSIHNAARARVPAIIVAGLSPVTTGPERSGSRTEFIHYTQDSTRQHEIGGQYMKWSYELRAAEMVEPVFLRGYQLATTEPQGPVYLTGAREVWEEKVPAAREAPAMWKPSSMGELSASDISYLHESVIAARRPLVITTYAGRHPASVGMLAQLAELLGFAVAEVSPNYVNFPGDHPLHLGYRRNAHVADADLILMLDVDVPWLYSKVRPASGARLFHIDVDPIKPDLGFWHFPAERSWCADSGAVLRQWLRLAAGQEAPGLAGRLEWIRRAKQSASPPKVPAASDDAIDAQSLSSAIEALLDERSIIVFEAPTLTETLLSTLRMRHPGSYFANGGSGLGWGINAAIGIKLARPDADVITVTGDGSYLFGVPSSAFWVAQTYGAPSLTIVNNNAGWNAPKQSTLLVHPDGVAKRRDRFWVTTGAGAQYADIAAAASGAAAFKVHSGAALLSTLRQALGVVREGRSAVVDVVTRPISQQVLG